MQVWDVLRTALAENAGPKKLPKIGHLSTIAQLCRAISSQLRHVSTIGKITCEAAIPPQHVLTIWWTCSPLAAEIGPVVWGTPANFNGFCILAALLHGTVVVGVSQTLQHWTVGATYIRQLCIIFWRYSNILLTGWPQTWKKPGNLE